MPLCQSKRRALLQQGWVRLLGFLSFWSTFTPGKAKLEGQWLSKQDPCDLPSLAPSLERPLHEGFPSAPLGPHLDKSSPLHGTVSQGDPWTSTLTPPQAAALPGTDQGWGTAAWSHPLLAHPTSSGSHLLAPGPELPYLHDGPAGVGAQQLQSPAVLGERQDWWTLVKEEFAQSYPLSIEDGQLPSSSHTSPQPYPVAHCDLGVQHPGHEVSTYPQSAAPLAVPNLRTDHGWGAVDWLHQPASPPVISATDVMVPRCEWLHVQHNPTGLLAQQLQSPAQRGELQGRWASAGEKFVPSYPPNIDGSRLQHSSNDRHPLGLLHNQPDVQHPHLDVTPLPHSPPALFHLGQPSSRDSMIDSQLLERHTGLIPHVRTHSPPTPDHADAFRSDPGSHPPERLVIGATVQDPTSRIQATQSDTSPVSLVRIPIFLAESNPPSSISPVTISKDYPQKHMTATSHSANLASDLEVPKQSARSSVLAKHRDVLKLLSTSAVPGKQGTTEATSHTSKVFQQNAPTLHPYTTAHGTEEFRSPQAKQLKTTKEIMYSPSVVSEKDISPALYATDHEQLRGDTTFRYNRAFYSRIVNSGMDLASAERLLQLIDLQLCATPEKLFYVTPDLIPTSIGLPPCHKARFRPGESDDLGSNDSKLIAKKRRHQNYSSKVAMVKQVSCLSHEMMTRLQLDPKGATILEETLKKSRNGDRLPAKLKYSKESIVDNICLLRSLFLSYTMMINSCIMKSPQFDRDQAQLWQHKATTFFDSIWEGFFISPDKKISVSSEKWEVQYQKKELMDIVVKVKACQSPEQSLAINWSLVFFWLQVERPEVKVAHSWGIPKYFWKSFKQNFNCLFEFTISSSFD